MRRLSRRGRRLRGLGVSGNLSGMSVGRGAQIVDRDDMLRSLAAVGYQRAALDFRNGTFRATAFIGNDSGDLAPGMFGRFTIAYERHADALVLQASAAFERARPWADRRPRGF